MGQAAEIQEAGQFVPALAFLRTVCPPAQLDKWGEPLPLSDPDQARLDRLFAVTANPLERGWALVQSGTIDPGEAECIAMTSPDAYQVLVSRARMDMAQAPPPYSMWAEQTLGVLFGQPAAKVYKEAPPPKPPAPSPGKSDEATGATQADRREISVRQKGQP